MSLQPALPPNPYLPAQNFHPTQNLENQTKHNKSTKKTIMTRSFFVVEPSWLKYNSLAIALVFNKETDTLSSVY